MGNMAAAMAISLHSLVPCIFENEYTVKLLKMFTREQQRRQYLQEYWQEDAIPTGEGWNTVADMEDADWTSIFENEYKVKLLKMFIREQQRRQDLQEGHWQEEVRPSESPLFDEEAEDNDKDWRDPCEDQDEEDEEQYMEEEHWEQYMEEQH